MNFLTVLILAAMLADFGIGMAADLLNLKNMGKELPQAFKGWYDPRRYAEAQQYLMVRTRLGWAVSGVDLAAVLVFWFAGGFAWLDGWVRGFHWGPIGSGILFIATLLAIKAALDEPFSLYSTFVVEARFGFNRTTWGTYLMDRLKGAALAAVLGGPLLAAVLAFFEYAGPNAWWACWLVVTVFMLAVQYIAPTWIMPLFNRFEELPQGALRDAITAYALKIDFQLDNIFVMDGSKRSTKSNAFFTGFGRHRRIVLFDTLIDRHETSELVSVLAHEMGHYKLKHIAKMMAAGIGQAGLMFFILSYFISYPPLFHAFYLNQVSVYAGLVLFGMLYAPLDGFLGLVNQSLSRRNEYAADGFAVQTASEPRAMIAALKKLSMNNLSNLQPHPFYVFLHYSHPPVLQRIEAIEKELGEK